MKKIYLFLMLFFVCLTIQAQEVSKVEFSVNIKKNFNHNLLDLIAPLPSNNNLGVLPFLGLGFNEAGVLGRLSFYFGFNYQNFNVSGNYVYRDEQYDDFSEGDLKVGLGYYSPVIGGKFYLSEKTTRPYLHAHLRVYIPNLKTDGTLFADDETYTWDSNEDVGSVFKDKLFISNTELGIGIEHRFTQNKNIALFGEYNLQFFSFAINVNDAEVFMDELTDAINNIERGNIDTDIDVEDLNYIEGHAKSKIKYMSSYASLGISFFF